MVGMLATPLLSAAPRVGSFVGSLFGGNTAAADPGRLAANMTAYNAARNGDENGRLFLLGRTGTTDAQGGTYVPGPLGLPDTPGRVKGWAGTVARPDAAAKLASLGTPLPPGTAVAVSSGPSPLQSELQRFEANARAVVAESVARIGSGGSAAAANAIGGSAGPTYAPAPITTTHIALAAAAIVGVILLLRK